RLQPGDLVIGPEPCERRVVAAALGVATQPLLTLCRQHLDGVEERSRTSGSKGGANCPASWGQARGQQDERADLVVGEHVGAAERLPHGVRSSQTAVAGRESPDDVEVPGNV